MTKIIDNVLLLEVNKNDLLNLNEIINENFLETKELLKNETSKIHSEATIFIEGNPKNYNFKIISENEESILIIESIIDKIIN
jgi:hypothetical protein